MKKLAIIAIALIIVLLGLFLWLLGGASPDNAPQEVKTIELPDTYEK